MVRINRQCNGPDNFFSTRLYAQEKESYEEAEASSLECMLNQHIEENEQLVNDLSKLKSENEDAKAHLKSVVEWSGANS